MRILMIGGTNLTGPYILQNLVSQGHKVALFHRKKSPTPLPESVIEILGDKKNLTHSLSFFQEFKPEVALHMVAYTREDAETFMNAFQGIARRVVVPSSIDVYCAYGRLHGSEPGEPDPMPLTEDSPLREKLSVRGEGYEKKWVEQVVMNHPTLPGTILRLPMIYGRNDGGRTFPYVKRMQDHRPFILLDEIYAQWQAARGYSENVAHAITLAVTQEKARHRIYNVAELETPCEQDWVQKIAHLLKWPGKIIVVPRYMKLGMDGDFRQQWIVDTHRIREELGYKEIVAPDEGLARTVAWQSEHSPAVIDPTNFNYAEEDQLLENFKNPPVW
ncbi:MAG: NAD-dependent epimerase/dehydratase family protein [Planctomycetota bacterium]